MALDRAQWIVVSGAAGALGSALAKHFQRLGMKVLGLDRSFDAVPQMDGVTTCAVDLLREEDVRNALADTIPASEPIGLLINAVGLIWNEPILTFKGSKLSTHGLETWRAVIDANLTAPFVVSNQVAARMVRRGGGSIVNFSSIASAGNAGQAAYSAAKAGIEGLTRTMAIELGPLGVRVNAVALGFIDVSTTRNAVVNDMLQRYTESTPLGRLGAIEDVVGAIEFLAGNNFANAAIIRLDGGLRI